MFQSALYSKPPVLTAEEINIGIEKSFEQLDKATALAERLTLARESFNAIPAENMSQQLVTLFASNFVDVPSHLVPETSSKALESAQRASGKELKAFALESGDGVISKIWAFIKKLIEKIRDFLKGIFKGRSAKVTIPGATFDFSNVFNVTIKPNENFAVFSIGGKVGAETINKVANEMSKVSVDLLNICIRIHQQTSKMQYSPKIVEDIFGLEKQLKLIADSDWPGSAYITVSENMEAEIVMEKKGEKPSSIPEFELSRMSVMKSYGQIVEKTHEQLLKAVKELDNSLAKLDKEADALAKEREGMPASKSSDVIDVIDINTPREVEKSPQAIRMFVKIIGTLTSGISGASLKFSEHQYKAMKSIAEQGNAKLSA